VEQIFTPLPLQWPDWLSLPGGKLVSQRTNPHGRVPTWVAESCPGDVIGKPSQGCLEKVFDSTEPFKDVYGYFEDLLTLHNYTTEAPSTKPYANIAMGKSIGDRFGSLKMREYPEPQDEDYYRQIQVFIRELSTTGHTKIEITFLVKNLAAAAAAPAAAPTAAPAAAPKKASFFGMPAPPARGTYRWAVQSVATGSGAQLKYSSFYYETATGRSIDEPISLPGGAMVVGVFPDDCAFTMQNDSGAVLAFRNEADAKAKGIGPGTWSVFPRKCGGVVVFLR